jgi:hypothetical protein
MKFPNIMAKFISNSSIFLMLHAIQISTILLKEFTKLAPPFHIKTLS